MLPDWQLFRSSRSSGRVSFSRNRWEKELQAAGFMGVEADASGFGYPWDLKLGTVSRVPYPVPSKKKINFLYGSNRERWSKTVKRLFTQDGYATDWCTLESLPPADEDVIAFLDLEGPFFDAISKENYDAFIQYLSSRKGRTLWVTRPTQMSCKDPRFGFVLGLARTIRYEAMLDFGTLEIDNFDATAAKRVVDVYEKFARQHSTDHQDPECEFSLHQGTIYTARFHWMPLEQQQLPSPETDIPKSLEVASPGDLHSLAWAEKDVGELGPDEVEVNITHVGLNFRVCIHLSHEIKE